MRLMAKVLSVVVFCGLGWGAWAGDGATYSCVGDEQCYYPSAEAFFAALDRIKHEETIPAVPLLFRNDDAPPEHNWYLWNDPEQTGGGVTK